MKLVALCIGLVISSAGFSQDNDKNLVENSGFESYEGRLKRNKQIELATGWLSSTKTKADLYETGNKYPDANAPLNPHGSEEATEGSNYAGIRIYSQKNDKLPRTYIATEFSKGLKKGLKYCVSFKISLADMSKYASNNISAYISKKPPMAPEESIQLLIDEEPQVQHSRNKVFNAQYGWETVCSVIEAKGGEKWITIGNFKPDNMTKTERMKKPKITGMVGSQIFDAYYYIDDVQVFLLEDASECDCESDITTEEEDIVYRKTIISKDELDNEALLEASTIYFSQSSKELDDFAIKELDQLIGRMKSDADIKIEITGHCDSDEIEAGKANPLVKYMAQKRVNVIKKYLLDNGITEDRFTTVVKDDTDPADSSGTPIGNAKNRRVEFKLK